MHTFILCSCYPSQHQHCFRVCLILVPGTNRTFAYTRFVNMDRLEIQNVISSRLDLIVSTIQTLKRDSLVEVQVLFYNFSSFAGIEKKKKLHCKYHMLSINLTVTLSPMFQSSKLNLSLV